ncbi:hypothetical protein ZWY2020_044289 [Hordeum vulgare]|nr:hypothetical protein ZWY2020_044289 [Hordeum vulgare]
MAAEADAASATTPGVVASSSPLRLPRPSHHPTTQPHHLPVFSPRRCSLSKLRPRLLLFSRRPTPTPCDEGAIINLTVRMAMNGSTYTLWRGLMLKVIDCATLLSRSRRTSPTTTTTSPGTSSTRRSRGGSWARWSRNSQPSSPTGRPPPPKPGPPLKPSSSTIVGSGSGMLLHDEIDADYSDVSSHSALAIHTKPPPSVGAASGSLARPPLTRGSGGGKPGSPSPNQGHNKRRLYSNNGGYHGVVASTPPWTGQVYA